MRFRSRSSLRALAGFLAAALLCAQIGAAAHEAAVRHVRCAEHDELVEVVDAPHAQAPAREHAVQRDDAQLSHAHEHCALAAFGAQRAPVRRAPFQLTATAPAKVAALERAQVAPVVSLPLYRLAPKNSPPLV